MSTSEQHEVGPEKVAAEAPSANVESQPAAPATDATPHTEPAPAAPSQEVEKSDIPSAPAAGAAPGSAAPAPADVSLTSANGSATSNAEARMQNALAALLKVLDNDDPSAAAPPLRTVQKMCMRIPQLSSEMSRPQRLQLYKLLLLDDDEQQQQHQMAAALPESWSAFAEKALETHTAVAQQAAALFPADLGVTVEELAGLFYHLGAETAFYFNPEMIDVILCITYVVAGGRSGDKAQLLRTLYRLLCVLQKDFLVSTASRLYEPATTALLRLMLQFYDPALATHVDQQQVEVGAFVLEWSRRLLVLHGDYEAALKVLDWVFILGDPVMIPYVAQAYLITHRQHLLSLQTKQALTSCLREMKLELSGVKSEAVDPKLVDGRATALMPVWSGKSLLQNADLLYRVTPLSTQRMLDFCLYPDVGTLNKTPEDLQQYYANTPCLPLERSDIASAFPRRAGNKSNSARTAQEGGEAVPQNGAAAEENEVLPAREYIIVDCRSKASYDYVRLPTAILVGDVLSYQQEELAVAMSRLESCRGHPLALFGTGRPIVEEMNLLKVLALYLINKKAFPFVCIVPGGFKTTIPLLRNRVIEAVLSPAAAASLDATAKSTGVDWGQQASSTAHNISAKLSEISGLLPHVETAEVRQRAEELGSKAKESVAAAGTWGWGMMQRLREGLSETRDQASTAFSSVATKLSATQAGTAPAAAPPGTNTAPTAFTTAAASGAPAAPPNAGIANAKQHQQQQQQQIFSLGEEGEEDDLDLITSIPTRPMRGAVVELPQPSASDSGATAAAPAAAAPSDVPPMTAAPSVPAAHPAAPEAPQQPSTPNRPTSAPAPSTTNAAAASPASPAKTEEAPADASPAPVPPQPSTRAAPAPTTTTTTTATASSTGGVPRGASASQIAANIDAEFDELFGDLNTSQMPANRASASPTKPAAAVNEDDLFGE